MIVKEPEVTYANKNWAIGFSDHQPFMPIFIDERDSSFYVRQLKYNLKSQYPQSIRANLIKSLRGKLSQSKAKKLISEINQLRKEWERDF